MNTEEGRIIIGGCWLEDIFRLLLEFPECDIEVRRSSFDEYHYEVVLKRRQNHSDRQRVKLSRDAARDLALSPALFDKILEKADIIAGGTDDADSDI